MEVVQAWSDMREEGVIKEVVIRAYIESSKMVWCFMCVLSGVASYCEFGVNEGD